MDESYRERLQGLVNAIHLTAAALVQLEWEREVFARPSTEKRSGAPVPIAAWWPTLEPRGWPPNHLGTESDRMFPYFAQMVPQMIPMMHGMGGPGLLHAGINPMSGGYPFSPIPQMHPMQSMPMQSIPSGMVPQGMLRSSGMIPYGYGLLHSGWEMQGMGAQMGGINPLGYPQGSMGYGAYVPMPAMMSVPMQPAWSMGPMPSPTPSPTPHI